MVRFFVLITNIDLIILLLKKKNILLFPLECLVLKKYLDNAVSIFKKFKCAVTESNALCFTYPNVK